MTIHSFNPGVDADTGSAHYEFFFSVSTTETLVTDTLACKNNDRLNDTEDVTKYSGFVRFPMTGISQGTQITTAHLRLKVLNAWDASVPDMLVRAVDEDTPTAPTTYANYFSKSRTTAQTLWDWSGSGDDEFAANEYITVDVTSAIQEVINRPSWDGSAVVLLLEPNNQTTHNVAHNVITQNFEETLSDTDEPQLSVLIQTMNNLSQEVHRFEPGYDIADDTLLTDFSGSYKHGWIRGASFVSDGGSNALEFDGTDDYVKLIEEVLIGLDNFSICFWLKADTTTGNHPIYTKGDYDSTSGSYNVRQNAASMQLSVYYFSRTYTSQVTSAQWDHFAFVYQKSTGLALYRNASSQTPIFGPGIPVTVPSSSVVSYLGRDPSNYFDGKLDSIRVFSRALTTDEITALASERGYNDIPGAIDGEVIKTLDTITLLSEGLRSIEGELSQSIDVSLLATASREREGELAQTITIGVESEAFIGTLGELTAEITLDIISEAESPRLGTLTSAAETLINLSSEATNAVNGEVDFTLDDILAVANNYSAELSVNVLDDITLDAYGAEQVEGVFSTVITVSLSSTAHPPILGSLTEILDDVILLQLHNLPPIPDNDNSPLLDSCPSLFIGETDATFCSRS